MEFYTLNANLQRTELIDEYESLIWTDRYQAYGDFQLNIDPKKADPRLFSQGTLVAVDKSNRLSSIVSTEIKADEDGKRTLECKGYSFEAKMLERPNAYVTTLDEEVVLGDGTTKHASDIVRGLFSSICSDGNVTYPVDKLPFIQGISGILSLGRIPEPSDFPVIQTKIGTLYETIKKICDVYGLGFQIIRPADEPKLYFSVYTGFDRTTAQQTLTPVVFDPKLNTLTDTSELTVSSEYRNVAYVYSPNGFRIVYTDGATAATAGLDRKVLLVDANDITDPAGAGLDTKLDQRGQEELAKSRSFYAFDGKIPTNGPYKYGVDYWLGDLVEKRGDSGIASIMRVSEQIFVSDKEGGDREYPTLTLDTVVVPGSWESASPDKVWDNYTTETWDSM